MYASESPVLGSSDSDHEFHECAEDFGATLEPEDQVGGQAGGQDIDIPGNQIVRSLT